MFLFSSNITHALDIVCVACGGFVGCMLAVHHLSRAFANMSWFGFIANERFTDHIIIIGFFPLWFNLRQRAKNSMQLNVLFDAISSTIWI